jgi:hypothetical protein
MSASQPWWAKPNPPPLDDLSRYFEAKGTAAVAAGLDLDDYAQEVTLGFPDKAEWLKEHGTRPQYDGADEPITLEDKA